MPPKSSIMSSRATRTLAAMPQEVLVKVAGHALRGERELLLPLLTSCKSLGGATLAALLEHLELDDDDQVLLTAEEEPSSGLVGRLLDGGTTSPLAALVKHLAILAPSRKLDHDHVDGGAYKGLESAALLALVGSLTRLTAMSWRALRPPPIDLCRVLGATCGSTLESFAVEGDAFDGVGMDCLPSSIRTLSLSLSGLGCRQLAQAASRGLLPNLEELNLSESVSTDDSLFFALGKGCTKLAKLRIADMGGTRLTAAGLANLFEHCPIELLSLDNVQRRLSKTCWEQVATHAAFLTSFSLIMNESGPHHSWAADHYESLPSLLKQAPVLREFVVSRRVRQETVFIRAHNCGSDYPISPCALPKGLPPPLFEALTSHGKRLTSLNIDFFTSSVPEIKFLLESCPEIAILSMTLDAPFKSLSTSLASVLSYSSIKSLTVSIDPSHTPQFGQTMAVLSFPFNTTNGESAAAGTPSAAAPSELQVFEDELPAGLMGAMPNVREWRRWLKKANKVERILWTGRGGLGEWDFSSSGGASAAARKITFTPIDRLIADGRLPASSVAAGAKPPRAAGQSLLANLDLGPKALPPYRHRAQPAVASSGVEPVASEHGEHEELQTSAALEISPSLSLEYSDLSSIEDSPLFSTSKNVGRWNSEVRSSSEQQALTTPITTPASSPVARKQQSSSKGGGGSHRSGTKSHSPSQRGPGSPSRQRSTSASNGHGSKHSLVLPETPAPAPPSTPPTYSSAAAMPPTLAFTTGSGIAPPANTTAHFPPLHSPMFLASLRKGSAVATAAAAAAAAASGSTSTLEPAIELKSSMPSFAITSTPPSAARSSTSAPIKQTPHTAGPSASLHHHHHRFSSSPSTSKRASSTSATAAGASASTSVPSSPEQPKAGSGGGGGGGGGSKKKNEKITKSGLRRVKGKLVLGSGKPAAGSEGGGAGAGAGGSGSKSRK